MLLTTMLGIAAASPARADPSASWRVTFTSNTTVPSTGVGFGYRGSCYYAGGVTQGDAGGCEVAAYIHQSAGSGFTCHMSQTITHWATDTGTFVESGTATVTPTALTEPCLIFTGGSSPFTLDTGIPAAPGHYNFGVNPLVPGAVGEYNVTVVQLP
jgi:hypothetical protein